jgi:hypothetical protein
MNLNIIISCRDGDESQVQYLMNILRQFKKIIFTPCLVYSGNNPKFPCNMHVKAKNSFVELHMILAGLKYFKGIGNEENRFLKLSAHTWPLNEDKIIDIFNALAEAKSPYAGNWWHNNLEGSLAADFFCLDFSYGNIFDKITNIVNDSEVTLYYLLKNKNKLPYIIPERDPILWNNFYTCDGLCLTAHKKLQLNLAYARNLNETGRIVEVISAEVPLQFQTV